MNVYDSLNLTILHAFASPTPRFRPGTTNPDEWERVSQLIVNGHTLLASVASRVVAWRAVFPPDKNVKGKAKKTGRGRINPAAKWQGESLPFRPFYSPLLTSCF